ncbi:MAG TPA: hypothetical protein VK929_03095 [Longimicrobiales bacterium]|nr:hypothetical protein [Longimicrobiales bacterium]
MRARRRGFVLLAVLWLVVALAAVGLDAALRSQAQRLDAVNHIDAGRAREAALAGSEYARSRLTAALLERRDELEAEVRRAGAQGGVSANRSRNMLMAQLAQDDPWHEPARFIMPSMELGDAEFFVHARDTGMMLNINSAPEEMLRDFFAQGMRIDYAWADRLAQAILDWRDEDDLPRVNGAERDEYLAAGAAVLPANRPFNDVSELRFVLGMTPELFDAIRPHLTTMGSGRINVNAAPRELLAAVPTFTPAVVEQIIMLRESGVLIRNTTDLRNALGNGFTMPTGAELQNLTRRVTFATNEVEIVSRGRVVGSPVTATVRSIVGRSQTAALLLLRRLES